MPVTELALIKLRSGYDDLDFLECVMEAQEVQDSWSRHHQPHILPNRPYDNLSTFCVQKAEPPYLLITAPWDSPEAHGEWIKSKENQSVFARLGEYIAPGCNSVLLFHMDSAGEQMELRADLFTKEGFKVCRMSANPDKKEAVQTKYRMLEDEVRKTSPGNRIWAGWRIEKTDDVEDLVVFWSSGVSDAAVHELLDLAENKSEIRNFQQIA